MTNVTARDAALQALRDVEINSAYASQAIDRQLSRAALSPEDRRLATGIFYTAAENRLYIEYLLAPLFKSPPEPLINDILHIACAQILFFDRVPDHAAVDEAVKQTRNLGKPGATGYVNGILRNIIRARDDGKLRKPPDELAERISVLHSVALSAVKRLIAAYGAAEAEKICAYRPEKRTQTVRANTMTTTDEQLGVYLHARNIAWTPGLAPHSFICQNPGAIAELDGYRKGMFSVQGVSSMLAAYAVEPKPGMNILDACAAPGGKSALICEIMNGTGRVYAWDIHEHRVELIRATGKRLKLYNLRPSMRDARQPLAQFSRLMDAVLVDAPCSGLGVMGDKPDIRTKIGDAEIESLLPLQRDILSQCAEYVKVGGLLVYSTCTILPEENENQAREFLKTHPEFAPDSGDSWLPERLRPRLKNGMANFLQHRDGVEGFFIARFRRMCL